MKKQIPIFKESLKKHIEDRYQALIPPSSDSTALDIKEI